MTSKDNNVSEITDMNDMTMPNIQDEQLSTPQFDQFSKEQPIHKPRILLLYGSLRETSYSRRVVLECARILNHFGAETRIFNPEG